MAEKVTIEDLDDVQDFLNKEDSLARLKYLGKQELVLVSAYLEIKIQINHEIEWKKLEIEREIKEKELAMKEKEIEKEREMKEKEMEMKRLELQEKEKERKHDDYDKVKKVVLIALQLVPEAYRQKVRNLKKTSEHTFTQFANFKKRLFQEWCASRKVKTKEQLEQLVLLEDSKECLTGDLKTYLEEQQVP
ncbi:uncharacterized protein [Procambarus clarkii]|uniref:uncharacterized protein n=1 Tax=Procambarus clarkii TaxID=6728 RepID=UPI0037439FCA